MTTVARRVAAATVVDIMGLPVPAARAQQFNSDDYLSMPYGNPCPGKLGVIEEGAYADLLLVDGNPLENLHLFDDPGKNLVLIMKDGKIYENTIK